ncbi:MAG: hypothetical protein U1F87_03155 [Kiritimatiellia bacterium]
MKKTCILAITALSYSTRTNPSAWSSSGLERRADIGTSIHPIYLYHQLPDEVGAVPGKVPLGGDVSTARRQAEVGWPTTSPSSR